MFLELRDKYMKDYKWSRRKATLAARIKLVVDNFDIIDKCISFTNNKLLSNNEKESIVAKILKNPEKY